MVMVPLSPFSNGFSGNSQLPFSSTTVVTVLPSGSSTVTMPSGSPVPLRPLPLLSVMTGGSGAITSAGSVTIGGPTFPGGSVMLPLSPFSSGLSGNAQLPFSSATVVTVPPSEPPPPPPPPAAAARPPTPRAPRPASGSTPKTA